MLWRVFQLAIVFGTIWFFTEVAPPTEASLGAKAFLGFVFAFLATVLLSQCWDLITRGKKRLHQLRKPSGATDLIGRRTD